MTKKELKADEKSQIGKPYTAILRGGPHDGQEKALFAFPPHFKPSDQVTMMEHDEDDPTLLWMNRYKLCNGNTQGSEFTYEHAGIYRKKVEFPDVRAT